MDEDAATLTEQAQDAGHSGGVSLRLRGIGRVHCVAS